MSLIFSGPEPRFMMESMFSRGHYLKITKAVVLAVVVYVMHNFSSLKNTSDFIGHYKAMLENKPSWACHWMVYAYRNITIRCYNSAAFIIMSFFSAWIQYFFIANPRATRSLSFLYGRWFSFKRFMANVTSSIFHNPIIAIGV